MSCDTNCSDSPRRFPGLVRMRRFAQPLADDRVVTVRIEVQALDLRGRDSAWHAPHSLPTCSTSVGSTTTPAWASSMSSRSLTPPCSGCRWSSWRADRCRQTCPGRRKPFPMPPTEAHSPLSLPFGEALRGPLPRRVFAVSLRWCGTSRSWRSHRRPVPRPALRWPWRSAPAQVCRWAPGWGSARAPGSAGWPSP